MNKKIRFMILLVVASFLLAACTIQAKTNINADGSGEWITEFGFNQADIAELSEFDMTPEEFCSDPETMADMPPGTEVSIEERGDETWCVFVTPFESLDELRQNYQEGEGITVNRLEIIDGQFYYDLEVDLSDEDSGDLEDFEFNFSWQLTPPGRVGDNNADTKEGNTLIWDLNPGEVIHIHAESSTSSGLGDIFGSGDIPWIAIAVVCLCGLGIIVVGVGVVVFFVMRKRKGDSA